MADARNEADQAAWQVEKMLKENADKIQGGDKASVQAAIEKVESVKDGNDVDAIKNAANNLHTAAHAMSQYLGRGAGRPPPGPGPQQGGGGGKDDVIDAEFEVKK